MTHSPREILRLMTCGNVDDGKSTLIGRMLLDTQSVSDDQRAALRQDTERFGTTDAEEDPALLLDGLEDERAQGITIDVAYRYFDSARRTFIIADSPGHEQYTRNMATAASNSQLAIVLIDARKGIMTQTRRHTFIAALMGIRQIVLAINKMDLVDFSEPIFRAIMDEYNAYAGQFGFSKVTCIPLAALRGDNVLTPSVAMPWYADLPLIPYLESVSVEDNRSLQGFRLPIQRVSRPDSHFRGFCGTIASGKLAVGDAVTILPHRTASRIQSIVTMDGTLSQAGAGAAVTVTLDDEVDVSRGDMICHPEHLPQVNRRCRVVLVWMTDQPLVPGKPYYLKHATHRTTAEVELVVHRVDVNTQKPVHASTLQLNEIGVVQLVCRDPLIFDAYHMNRETGSLILVDKVTHETVAAGMIGDITLGAGSSDTWFAMPRSEHLQETVSRISAHQRAQRFGHRPSTILVTGLSGAGKTTIAYALEDLLFAAGRAVVVLDGQNLRHGISRDLGFSAAERSENLRRAAEIAKLMNDAGITCIAAFVAPDEETRERAMQVIGRERVMHVHLTAPLDVCRQRDRSGRYLAADRGELVHFPGVTAPYAAPQDVDLTIPTDSTSVATAVAKIAELELARFGQPNPRPAGD